MSDLVKRQAVKDMLFYNWDECCSAVIGDLENIPSAQPERKTGSWLESKDIGSFWVCSNCKYPSGVYSAKQLYHYCPNCGSYNGGEQNE